MYRNIYGTVLECADKLKRKAHGVFYCLIKTLMQHRDFQYRSIFKHESWIFGTRARENLWGFICLQKNGIESKKMALFIELFLALRIAELSNQHVLYFVSIVIIFFIS